MLTYLEANLDPETLKPVAASPAGATLSAALIQSHQPRADAFAGMRIALAWLFISKTGEYWHNGGTGAHTCYVFRHQMSSDCKNYPPEGAILYEVAQSFSRFCQRKGFSHDRFDRTRLQ
jgi:hypothetical protein